MTDAIHGETIRAFGASPDVVALLRPDGIVTALSRAFAGATPEDAPGRPFAALILPAHAEPLERALAAVVEGAPSRRLDVASALPSGAIAWHQLSIAPMKRGDRLEALLVIAAEVTERKESEDRLRRADALLVDAQGTAHLGTWEWDVSQPHVTWSDELYRIFGLSPETYTPSYEGYLKMVHPDDRALVEAATSRVFQEHQPYSHDERISRPDGSMRYLHTWAHAIVDDHGKLVRLIGVCQDITDRKLMEHHLRQVHKLEALGRLAGGIAHDINNVMGVVIGYASIVSQRLPQDSPFQGQMTEILRAGERAAGLTKRLLAFSREQVVQPGQHDLSTIVSDLAGMLEQLIGEDLEMSTSCAPRECGVEGDRTQLEQVVVNLVLNARDAMPDGGQLAVSVEPVRIASGDPAAPGLAGGEYVCLTVTDTGVGMDDEVRSKIFDPFFTTKEEGKGTGLGLSTVYGIVTQCGGAIHVQSAPGKGSRFEVYLPRVELTSPAVQTTGSLRPRQPGTETILLVEDQQALRRAIRDTLTDLGYAVIEAADGPDALQKAEAHRGVIHLLLTDVVMPKMGGRELAERLVAGRPDLQVLYMSGHARDVALRDVVARDRAAFLQKPFAPPVLAERLRALLDGRAELRSPGAGAPSR